MSHQPAQNGALPSIPGTRSGRATSATRMRAHSGAGHDQSLAFGAAQVENSVTVMSFGAPGSVAKPAAKVSAHTATAPRAALAPLPANSNGVDGSMPPPPVPAHGRTATRSAGRVTRAAAASIAQPSASVSISSPSSAARAAAAAAGIAVDPSAAAAGGAWRTARGVDMLDESPRTRPLSHAAAGLPMDDRLSFNDNDQRPPAVADDYAAAGSIIASVAAPGDDDEDAAAAVAAAASGNVSFQFHHAAGYRHMSATNVSSAGERMSADDDDGDEDGHNNSSSSGSSSSSAGTGAGEYDEGNISNVSHSALQQPHQSLPNASAHARAHTQEQALTRTRTGAHVYCPRGAYGPIAPHVALAAGYVPGASVYCPRGAYGPVAPHVALAAGYVPGGAHGPGQSQRLFGTATASSSVQVQPHTQERAPVATVAVHSMGTTPSGSPPASTADNTSFRRAPLTSSSEEDDGEEARTRLAGPGAGSSAGYGASEAMAADAQEHALAEAQAQAQAQALAEALAQAEAEAELHAQADPEADAQTRMEVQAQLHAQAQAARSTAPRDPSEEYEEDIYYYLVRAETANSPRSDYIEAVQTDLSHTMRSILIDWMVEVVEEYQLAPQTLFLAIHYVDRMLSQEPVHRVKLQLVGVAAVLIAAKYEDVRPPLVDQLVFISDNSYQRSEVLRMETVMLTTLNFGLTLPTALDFCYRYARAGNVTGLGLHIATFLIELAAQEPLYIGHRPSAIAAAAIFLTRYILLTHHMHRTTLSGLEQARDEAIAAHGPLLAHFPPKATVGVHRLSREAALQAAQTAWPRPMAFLTRFALPTLSQCVLSINHMLICAMGFGANPNNPFLNDPQAGVGEMLLASQTATADAPAPMKAVYLKYHGTRYDSIVDRFMPPFDLTADILCDELAHQTDD